MKLINKKLLMCISIFALLVFVIGCSSKPEEINKKSKSTQSKKPFVTTTINPTAVPSLVTTTIIELIPSTTIIMENKECNDDCQKKISFDAFAGNIDDINECNKISSDKEIGGCYANVIRLKKNNDFSFCDAIGNQKAIDECYNKIAFWYQGYDMCLNFPEKYKEDCIYNAAFYGKLDDVNVCNKIIQEERLGKCYANVIRLKNKDASLCNYAPSQSAIDYCKSELKFFGVGE